MEKNELTYEGAMERLEILAREMEGGEVAIDQLAAKLKEAQQLLSFCKDKLTKADEEVQRLLADTEAAAD
jgi:exodeoxyribonuclease VII small subunit